MSHYEAYYNEQSGSGRGVHSVFVGSHGQRGHGVGSWLAGLFRRAIPFIAKGARAVGKEALRAGVNILDDVTDNRMTFKESFKNRMNESGKNLKRKAVDKINNLMEGSGYKGLAMKKNSQYPWDSASLHITSKRRRKRKQRKSVKRRKPLKRLKNKRKKKKSSKNRKSRKPKSKKKRKSTKVADVFG